jgi:acyl-CoA synthetase (AMP-forming)/AMP-acid ligase II
MMAPVYPLGRTTMRKLPIHRRPQERKEMILAGGQNIFPANIAVVMREHSAVAEVAVAGIPSPRVAY